MKIIYGRSDQDPVSTPDPAHFQEAESGSDPICPGSSAYIVLTLSNNRVAIVTVSSKAS